MKYFSFLLLIISSMAFAQNHNESDSLTKILIGLSPEEQISMLNNLAIENLNINPEFAAECSRLLMETAINNENISFQIQGLGLLATCYTSLSEFQLAIESFSEAIRIAEENGFLGGAASLKINLGHAYKNAGLPEKALATYLEALAYYHETRNEESIYDSYMNIAGVNFVIENYDKALYYYELTYGYYSDKGDLSLNAELLNNIGVVYFKQKKFQKALNHYRNALEMKKQTSDPYIDHILNNLGDVYLEMNEYSKAFSWFSEALVLYRSHGDKQSTANVLNALGDVLIKMGKPDEALQYQEEALSIAAKIGSNRLLRNIHKSLSEIYEQKNDLNKAFGHYKVYVSYKDSVLNKEISEQIVDIQTRFETEEKEKENEILRKDIDIKKSTQRLLIVVISGLVVLSVLIFLYYKARNASLNKEKLVKELEKNRLEEQFFAEKEISRIQNEKLEQKNRELSSTALHIVNKNSLLSNMLKEMDETGNSETKDINTCFDKLYRLISANLSLDNDWEQFRKHFDEVHPGFFEKLIHAYPTLTGSEQRLCAYYKINMGTKEIARMLNVSTSAIQKGRHRIRKKLNMASNIELPSFFNEF